jgi:hypothetical protein
LHFGAAAQQTVHAQNSPTDSFTKCCKCGFLRANMPVDVATPQQPAALFIAANSRHDWARVIEQNLTVTCKGF